MHSNTRPKHALIAYCALAQRLSTPGKGPLHALIPFLAEACRPFAGDLFDAAKLSHAVAQLYGVRIPRLAVLGMSEQLANEGLLVPVQPQSAIYRYAELPPPAYEAGVSPLAETEIELVLASFVRFCKSDEQLMRTAKVLSYFGTLKP